MVDTSIYTKQHTANTPKKQSSTQSCRIEATKPTGLLLQLTVELHDVNECHENMQPEQQ